MASKFEKLLEDIGSMTVLELSDFVKALEDKFGVSAAMPIAAVGGAMAPASEATPIAEEKSEYKVTLQEAGDKKIDVIKALRKVVPGLALTEAKSKAESAPVIIVSKEDAQKMKETLEAAGAKVQLS